MALDKQFYIYVILYMGISTAILFIIAWIAKSQIALKFKSIFARKSGKVLVNFFDESKGHHKEFVHLKQGTISVQPPWKKKEKKRIMIGYDPDHIYFDSTFGIRALNCNPKGSFYITGIESDEVSQAYATGEMAEDMIERAIASPDKSNQIDPKLIYLGAGVIAIICIASVYFGYKNFEMLESLQIAVQAIKASAEGGVL